MPTAFANNCGKLCNKETACFLAAPCILQQFCYSVCPSTRPIARLQRCQRTPHDAVILVSWVKTYR